MSDESLGRRLEAAGWDQGVLLPADPQLGWTVHFHLDEPTTKLTRGARNEAESEYRRASSGSAVPLLRKGYAHGIIKRKDRWVVASQLCDIVSDPKDEPLVLALRAFTTDNQPMLDSAATNSSRYFLLDPARHLIADIAVMTLIEKPLLARLTPERGAVDHLTKVRFTRWIGHRFTRPALDEDVIAGVVKPILDNLHEMQKNNDPDLSILETFQEMRVGHLEGPPPYEVRILFVVPIGEPSDGGLALARLIARMHAWLEPRVARITAWDALDLFQVSAGNYLSMDRLYLDRYTYQGRTVRGLAPPPPI